MNKFRWLINQLINHNAKFSPSDIEIIKERLELLKEDV